ncbi:MAG: hypothetical protein ACREVL_00055 [Solimonas sp.]
MCLRGDRVQASFEAVQRAALAGGGEREAGLAGERVEDLEVEFAERAVGVVAQQAEGALAALAEFQRQADDGRRRLQRFGEQFAAREQARPRRASSRALCRARAARPNTASSTAWPGRAWAQAISSTVSSRNCTTKPPRAPITPQAERKVLLRTC